MKLKIENIFCSPCPDVRVRTIDFGDSDTLILQKKRLPFRLNNLVTVVIVTNKLTFQFSIHNGYCWNGADIPRFLWNIIGSRTDNDFLIASLMHDYMLDFKFKILSESLDNQLTLEEYRRLTSLIFREIIIAQGTNKIKANIMCMAVDTFQRFFNKEKWGRNGKLQRIN